MNNNTELLKQHIELQEQKIKYLTQQVELEQLKHMTAENKLKLIGNRKSYLMNVPVNHLNGVTLERYGNVNRDLTNLEKGIIVLHSDMSNEGDDEYILHFNLNDEKIIIFITFPLNSHHDMLIEKKLAEAIQIEIAKKLQKNNAMFGFLNNLKSNK